MVAVDNRGSGNRGAQFEAHIQVTILYRRLCPSLVVFCGNFVVFFVDCYM